MVKVYHRRSRDVREAMDYQAGLLQKLYGQPAGQWLLALVTRPIMSYLLTLFDYTPWSRRKIRRFVETYGLQLSDYQTSHYRHFADFFQRKIRPELRPICSEDYVLAVADAKLQAFAIHEDLTLVIKGQTYRVAQLLDDDDLAQQFQGGQALIFRLGLEDLHHYLAAESGRVLMQRQIKGRLHSVREVAQRRRYIYRENKRAYCVIETDRGPVVQMEVGALLVGGIHNQMTHTLSRGQEKGHFGLGGSTIILLYPAQYLLLDEDIRNYSQMGLETQVQMGERIGVKNV